MRHLVKIIQTFTTVRTLIIEVYADTMEGAVESVRDSDAPPYEDERWEQEDELTNEEVIPAE